MYHYIKYKYYKNVVKEKLYYSSSPTRKWSEQTQRDLRTVNCFNSKALPRGT